MIYTTIEWIRDKLLCNTIHPKYPHTTIEYKRQQLCGLFETHYHSITDNPLISLTHSNKTGIHCNIREKREATMQHHSPVIAAPQSITNDNTN